uniref:Uncharacterized protein n=1 Tax=Oryza glumipatula TaxID=40148 RepID=A0A0E0AU15_9ORYZ
MAVVASPLREQHEDNATISQMTTTAWSLLCRSPCLATLASSATDAVDEPMATMASSSSGMTSTRATRTSLSRTDNADESLAAANDATAAASVGAAPDDGRHRQSLSDSRARRPTSRTAAPHLAASPARQQGLAPKLNQYTMQQTQYSEVF